MRVCVRARVHACVLPGVPGRGRLAHWRSHPPALLRYNLYQLTWDVTSSHPTRRTADEAADATSVSVAPDGGVASAQEPVDATTPRSTADADVDAASDGSGLDAGGPSTTPTTTTGTFMCYNVWNSNPPSWLWHNPRRRWELYSQRMDLLSEVVKGEAPDVLGLQEVRYDSTLAYATEHAQIKHLVQRLPGYQFVFQPANLYFDSVRVCPPLLPCMTCFPAAGQAASGQRIPMARVWLCRLWLRQSSAAPPCSTAPAQHPACLIVLRVPPPCPCPRARRPSSRPETRRARVS